MRKSRLKHYGIVVPKQAQWRRGLIEQDRFKGWTRSRVGRSKVPHEDHVLVGDARQMELGRGFDANPRANDPRLTHRQARACRVLAAYQMDDDAHLKAVSSEDEESSVRVAVLVGHERGPRVRSALRRVRGHQMGRRDPRAHGLDHQLAHRDEVTPVVLVVGERREHARVEAVENDRVPQELTDGVMHPMVA